MFDINLRRTTPKEKAFLRMVKQRIVGMGYSRKEARDIQVRALRSFRDDNVGRMDRLARGLTLNVKRYMDNSDASSVPEMKEIDS